MRMLVMVVALLVCVGFAGHAHAQFYHMDNNTRPAGIDANGEEIPTDLSKGQLELLEKARELATKERIKESRTPPPTQGFIFINQNTIDQAGEAAVIIRQARDKHADLQLVVSAPASMFPKILAEMNKQVTDPSIQWEFDADMKRASFFGVTTYPASGLLWKGKPHVLRSWDSWGPVLDRIGRISNPNKKRVPHHDDGNQQ